ncbi:hypothetical protein QOT17_002319 [Balamuthia mandrillaris]
MEEEAKGGGGRPAPNGRGAGKQHGILGALGNPGSPQMKKINEAIRLSHYAWTGVAAAALFAGVMWFFLPKSSRQAPPASAEPPPSSSTTTQKKK